MNLFYTWPLLYGKVVGYFFKIQYSLLCSIEKRKSHRFGIKFGLIITEFLRLCELFVINTTT